MDRKAGNQPIINPILISQYDPYPIHIAWISKIGKIGKSKSSIKMSHQNPRKTTPAII
jgi:hypothetical protein